MKSYIINKWKIEKYTRILTVIFWIINFMFLGVSANMLVKIILAGTSRWFDEAAIRAVSNDPFFIQRSELILISMVIVLIVVICFSAISVVLFRSTQLKNMYTQIGVYIVIGYDRKLLFKICMTETITDMIIAFPVSIVFSLLIWNKLSENDTIKSLLLLLESNWWIDIAAYMVAIIFMQVVVVMHTRIFIKQSIRKGIRYMLGNGVV